MSHHARNGFLTAKGLEEAAQRFFLEPDALAVEQTRRYLDKVASVSGLRRDETTMIFDEGVIDEQFERYSRSTELVS